MRYAPPLSCSERKGEMKPVLGSLASLDSVAAAPINAITAFIVGDFQGQFYSETSLVYPPFLFPVGVSADKYTHSHRGAT